MSLFKSEEFDLLGATQGVAKVLVSIEKKGNLKHSMSFTYNQ